MLPQILVLIIPGCVLAANQQHIQRQHSASYGTLVDFTDPKVIIDCFYTLVRSINSTFGEPGPHLQNDNF